MTNRLKQAWLALCVVALTGCFNEPPRDAARYVLVCAVDGKETYRSHPSRFWHVYDGGVWGDAGWHSQYKQSAWESCHTETYKGERRGE